MSEETIKEVLRMVPYGFYAITSKNGDKVNAMVANWLSQVSFEPRLVSLGLQKTSYSYGLITEGEVFCVNLFDEENEDAIKAYTKGRAKNPDKMNGVDYDVAPETGCPILPGASAYFECRVTQVMDIGGDHDIVVGEVVGAGVRDELEVTETLSLPKLGWSYAG